MWTDQLRHSGEAGGDAPVDVGAEAVAMDDGAMFAADQTGEADRDGGDLWICRRRWRGEQMDGGTGGGGTRDERTVP